MKCPKCGNENCQIISETNTTGKSYDAMNGICGTILLGPVGLLCGLCGTGNGKQTKTDSFWVCNNCGNKWKV